MKSSQTLRSQTKRAIAQDQLKPLLDQLQANGAMPSPQLSTIRRCYTALLVSLLNLQGCTDCVVRMVDCLFVCRLMTTIVTATYARIAAVIMVLQVDCRAWRL